jgi:hypothetical protein
MGQELKVIQDFYDLSVYLMGRILTFPRNLRHGLGMAMERRLQDLLALLLRAKYSAAAAKQAILREVNVELEVLRFQLRQATELKALPLGSQRHAQERLQQVGQQVGGWMRSLRPGAGVEDPGG